MSEALVLAKLTVHKLDEPTSERYYEQILPALKAVDGFRGLGLWRGIKGDGAHLAVYRYRDLDAAERGLEAISGQRSFTSAQSVITSPADVHRSHEICSTGKPITESPLGSYLSLSVRTAEPGYGQELAEELQMIFQELELIPGFLGSFVGISDTLAEEAVGLVTWTSEEAFRTSVPMRSPYEVSLFRRVV